ncbi:MAG: hypothetical protein H7338_11000 [Candidatus Sericytochromatia bacterium]|nr:hypothetical protein [Candidatus Sericytochromatia bacterium]
MFDDLRNDVTPAAGIEDTAEPGDIDGLTTSTGPRPDEPAAGETGRSTSADAKAVFTLWAYMNPDVVTSDVATPSSNG